MIADNLKNIREAIDAACLKTGRRAEAVKIMAVTKKVEALTIRQAYDCGIRVFGESRVQEARRKVQEGAFEGAQVCMIGHLQTNKAAASARVFSEIHSVDSIRVAQALSRSSTAHRADGAPVVALLQVNAGKDPAKYGVFPEDAFEVAEGIMELEGITLKGLMTIAPGPGEPELARKCFRDLRLLREELVALGIPRCNLEELSMGMTSDYEIAVEEGSTIVRLGTALFGQRSQKKVKGTGK